MWRTASCSGYGQQLTEQTNDRRPFRGGNRAQQPHEPPIIGIRPADRRNRLGDHPSGVGGLRRRRERNQPRRARRRSRIAIHSNALVGVFADRMPIKVRIRRVIDPTGTHHMPVPLMKSWGALVGVFADRMPIKVRIRRVIDPTGTHHMPVPLMRGSAGSAAPPAPNNTAFPPVPPPRRLPPSVGGDPAGAEAPPAPPLRRRRTTRRSRRYRRPADSRPVLVATPATQGWYRILRRNAPTEPSGWPTLDALAAGSASFRRSCYSGMVPDLASERADRAERLADPGRTGCRLGIQPSNADLAGLSTRANRRAHIAPLAALDHHGRSVGWRPALECGSGRAKHARQPSSAHCPACRTRSPRAFGRHHDDCVITIWLRDYVN